MGVAFLGVSAAVALIALSLLVLAGFIFLKTHTPKDGQKEAAELAAALNYQRRSIAWALVLGWLAACACVLAWELAEETLGLREQVVSDLSVNLGFVAAAGLFGLVAHAVLAYREARSPIVDRTIRQALLHTRKISDYLSPWMLALIAVGIVGIVSQMLVGLTDPHASAFFFVYSGTDAGESWTGILGPWFGIGNVIVVTSLLLLDIGTAVFAACNIVRRAQNLPAGFSDLDHVARQRSIDALAAFFLLALSLPNILFGAGMMATAGLALGERPTLEPTYVGIGVGGLVCALVGLVLMIVAAVVLWNQELKALKMNRPVEAKR